MLYATTLKLAFVNEQRHNLFAGKILKNLTIDFLLKVAT